MPKKVLMHIECLRGTGELTIASRIAHTLADRGIDVIIASGNTRHFFDKDAKNPHIKFCDLPPIQFDDKDTKDYMTGDGRRLLQAPDWTAERRKRLMETFDREKPDAVMVCYWPFGNGKGVLDDELAPFLKHVKEQKRNVPVFGSIREVLHVDSEPYKGFPAEAASIVNTYFDKLLVHGDRKLIPLTDEFDYLNAIPNTKLHYTGYATKPHRKPDGHSKDLILVTAGGGDFRPSAVKTLHAIISSLKDINPKFLHGKEIKIIAGKNFGEETMRELRKALEDVKPKLHEASADVEIIDTVKFKKFQQLLKHCGLLIGQAGIGTVMDTMTYGYPTVVIPIEERDEKGRYHFKEQGTRAELLAKEGVLRCVSEEELHKQGGAERLAEQINMALESPFTQQAAASRIQCNGANNCADFIAEELGVKPSRHKKRSLISQTRR